MSDIHGVNVDGTEYGLDCQTLAARMDTLQAYIDTNLQVATVAEIKTYLGIT